MYNSYNNQTFKKLSVKLLNELKGMLVEYGVIQENVMNKYCIVLFSFLWLIFLSKGDCMKRFLKWSYFWVLLVGILIGYFGIPMFSRILYYFFQ